MLAVKMVAEIGVMCDSRGQLALATATGAGAPRARSEVSSV
jgi:hypothetical protein